MRGKGKEAPKISSPLFLVRWEAPFALRGDKSLQKMPKVPQQDTPMQQALTKPCDNLNANELRYVAHISLPSYTRRWKAGEYLGAES